MKLLIFVFLLTLLGCAEIEEGTKLKNIKDKQENMFMTLQSGDKFNLADYDHLSLDISYSDSNSLQYRMQYWSWFYKITVGKKDSIILVTRSYLVK